MNEEDEWASLVSGLCNNVESFFYIFAPCNVRQLVFGLPSPLKMLMLISFPCKDCVDDDVWSIGKNLKQ